ncbi:MAG: 3-phosphoshikimate 1-carboxyvinyltransferase [Flavobacterium sp. SCGC AAA160-P02]|nr:MAG: 3-phosphoshikimate 1-carboxyvinyltransferase [Flavobacterium sp. SCGC AAA160-P02]
MNIYLKEVKNKQIVKDVFIAGSKSESNRLLILQKLFHDITIKNVSDSDDTHFLQKALYSEEYTINIGHAGTAMRFLTAFYASQKNNVVVLSGSERMHNRPIKILVKALKDLGADISYVQKEGYPPLKITGKELTKSRVQISGNTSSQYISALLLIAPSLKEGLRIDLLGEITSVPYINMTLSLLHKLGIETCFEDQIIQVQPFKNLEQQTFVVESDWSSASYFYSIVAFSDIGSEIRLSSFKKESLQGDSVLANIYEFFGVKTIFEENTILLTKVEVHQKESLILDLNKAPDIAQTVAVTCFGLGISCELTGLHTLKIKETDRLEALQVELTKLGAIISVSTHSLQIKSSKKINSNISIETYNDHRMAMSFAPLAMRTSIEILDADVVTKSYRNFWKDLQQIGFQSN